MSEVVLIGLYALGLAQGLWAGWYAWKRREPQVIWVAPDMLSAARRAVCALATRDEFSAEYEALDAAIRQAVGPNVL